MKVLVCGGRDFGHWGAIFGALDKIRAESSSTLTIIEGGAVGADAGAALWAMSTPGVAHVAVPADWRRHGKAAGPIRNQRMLDEHRPDMVLAFPGGRGTADMVRRAERAGVKVVKVTP